MIIAKDLQSLTFDYFFDPAVEVFLNAKAAYLVQQNHPFLVSS